MKKKDGLNVREEELLNFLWTTGEGLTSIEMAKKLEPLGWNKVTLLKTIQSLTDEGYLEVIGVEKCAKTYARRLAPSLTKEEYYSELLLKKGIDGSSLTNIVAALLGVGRKKNKDRNTEVIDKLEEIIAQLKTDNIENG